MKQILHIAAVDPAGWGAKKPKPSWLARGRLDMRRGGKIDALATLSFKRPEEITQAGCSPDYLFVEEPGWELGRKSTAMIRRTILILSAWYGNTLLDRMQFNTPVFEDRFRSVDPRKWKAKIIYPSFGGRNPGAPACNKWILEHGHEYYAESWGNLSNVQRIDRYTACIILKYCGLELWREIKGRE